MNVEWIITTVAGVAGTIAAFCSHYLYIVGQLYRRVSEAIDKAENQFYKGSEKFALAVDNLMEAIPIFLKPLIRRSFVEKVVQSAFDKIESYAQKQGNKINSNFIDTE